MSDFLRPHRLQPTRLFHSWDFPGKSTRVGCHFLLQRIFLTQGSNPGLPHCRQMLYCLSHQGSLLTPKPWWGGVGFFVLVWFFTAYLQYSSHILIQFRSVVTWLAFEEEGKILICFSLRKKKIFEIYSGQEPGNGERIYTIILKGVEHELN